MCADLRVGVVGVGTMGRHHARVYSELGEADLVGVCDADTAQARSVADEYDTTALERRRLLSACDAVSAAVPTRYHADAVRDALDAGTSVLVEKPAVPSVETGRDLLGRVRSSDAVVGVGHVERFNPAVESLRQVLESEDAAPLAVAARRQGPPVDRDSTDSVVMDLMIHDIDIVLSLANADLVDVTAAGTDGGRHVVATLTFADGFVASLTASRVSQRRVRDLTVSAPEFQVSVDYLDQSVEIHRGSAPEYVATDGDVRYRNESVIERPMVSNGEPLEAELAAFLDAVRADERPPVSLADGVRAVEVAAEVESAVARERTDGLTVSD